VSIPLSNHVKILGAVVDSRVTLSEHTKAVSKSITFVPLGIFMAHLVIEPSVPLVSSRLDYANSILHDIPAVARHISRYQRTKIPLHALLQANAILILVPPF